MRLIATTVVCVLVAFGAAFLVGRAANSHQNSATAATVTTIRTASRPAPAARTVRVNRALAAQFEPGLRGLRASPRVHHHRVVHHAAPPSTPAPVVTSAPASTQTVAPASPAPAPTPAPTYTAPPRTTAPPTTSRHKSGGSGTTTIG